MPDLQSLPWRLRYEYGASMAARARRQVLLATHRHVDLRIGGGVLIGPRFELSFPGPGRFHIGNECEFRRDFFCEIAPGGEVEFGIGTIFTSSALIQISTSLTTGSRVVIGQAVMIADGNHLFRDPDKHMIDQGYEFRPITIGDNAVITSKCTILNSVGEGAIIGPGSVVRTPIPPHSLAIGAPARVVEYFGPEDQRPQGMKK